MTALQRSGPDLDNGLSDESDLPAFLDISITSYHGSSFLCVLSVNPGPLLISFYTKDIYYHAFCAPGSVLGKEMDCSHGVFHPVVLETLIQTSLCAAVSSVIMFCHYPQLSICHLSDPI